MTPSIPDLSNVRIAIIGLGYVGLPLAVEFGQHFSVLGFDINPARIAELCAGYDRTREIEPAQLALATQLRFSGDPQELRSAGINVFIVTVPTPIDECKRPDLRPLLAASRTVGQALRAGSVVIYESTVYPGCTEEDCLPLLERESGLRANVDFTLGYSPERINPGDRQHRLATITKVTSGSTPEAADFVDALYARIVTAGTHKASSIRVAEAAKVIENTQRDLNIALVNELALIFHKLGIDTHEVLAAAGTKWNFLPFRPGLVGGHCIGVDPYYLTHKAQAIGYHPEVILAGRRINDGMGREVAERVVKLMLARGIELQGARVLILGFTFKEDCPDVRNTRVIDIVRALQDYRLTVSVNDPLADPAEVAFEYGLTLSAEPQTDLLFDAVILAVGHQAYREMGAAGIRRMLRPHGVVFDVKGVLPLASADGRL